jgi:hypothetical protein
MLQQYYSTLATPARLYLDKEKVPIVGIDPLGSIMLQKSGADDENTVQIKNFLGH